MNYTQWIVTLTIAIPAALVNLRTWLSEKPPFGTGSIRKLRRRIEYYSQLIETLEEDCPPSLHRDLSRARRDLAAKYAVTFDDSETTVAVRAATLCLPLMVIAMAIQSSATAGTGTIYIAAVLWLFPILLVLPALNVNVRLSARQRLYARLGNRDDLPPIPKVSPWPVISRTPSKRLIDKWINQATRDAGNDPTQVTEADIQRISKAIEDWHANPWWKPLRQRAAGVALRLHRTV